MNSSMDSSEQNSFSENNPEMPIRVENHPFVKIDFAKI